MGQRRRLLTPVELDQPFHGEWADRFPPILSVQRFADLLDISRKTLYEWIAKGRLDGAFRRRGKHILLWRTRALDILFNGKEWTND